MKKLLELFLILTLSMTVAQAQEPPVKDYYQAGKQVGYTAITVTTAGSIGRADNPLYVAGTVTADTKGTTITNWADAKTTTIGARIINSDGNVFSPSNALPVESGVNTLNAKMTNPADLDTTTIGARVTNWADADTTTIGSRIISGTIPITTTNNGGRDALDVHASQSGIWNVDTAGTTITNWADANTTTIGSRIINSDGTAFSKSNALPVESGVNTLNAKVTNWADADTTTIGSRTLDGDGNSIGSAQVHAGGRGLFTTTTLYATSSNAIASNTFNNGSIGWANYGLSILNGTDIETGQIGILNSIPLSVSPKAISENGTEGLINIPYHWDGARYVQTGNDNPMPVDIASADLKATTVGARVLASDGTTLSPTNALPVESGANSLNANVNVVSADGTPVATLLFDGERVLRTSTVIGAGDNNEHYAELRPWYGASGNGDYSVPVHILGSGLADNQKYITNPNYVTWTSGTGSDITVTAVAVHGYPDTGIAVYDAFNKGFNVTITASDVILDVDSNGATITNWADAHTTTIGARIIGSDGTALSKSNALPVESGVNTLNVKITNYADMVTATINTRTTIYSADKATAVAVDSYGAVVQMPIEHWKIHESLSYTMARKMTNVATTGTSYLIYHPTKNLHFKWSVGFDVETYAYLWEGGTFGGGVGRTLTAKNRNRTSASLTMANLSIIADALTVPETDETKSLWMGVMGSSGTGGARGSGDVSASDEFELKAGTPYYLYISPSNATNDGAVKFDFYSRD